MSFKENFTREEKQDEVAYDYSAFWTYAATFLIIFLVPLMYELINRILYRTEINDSKKYINCNCKACKDKLLAYTIKKRKAHFGFSFYILVISVISLSYLLFLSYEQIMANDGKLKGFNPFEILQISDSAEDREIKRAFRKLSVEFHPDKNKAPDAKAKFIMITKAYEALTDPVAKDNFKKYGNPDGVGSMRIGLALPPFVYDKKNHIPILVLFLIFIIIILPGGVYFWYHNSQQYDEHGFKVDNQKYFYNYLNENVLSRQMPFIVGTATEFANEKLHQEQGQALNELHKNFKDKFPKHQENTVSFHNKKAICLIYAYLDDNQKLITKDLENDTKNIINKLPDLIFSIYKNAIQWTNMYNNFLITGGGFQIKLMGYTCVKTIIDFSQNMHQRLSINSSPFQQLPHFTQDIIKKMKK